MHDSLSSDRRRRHRNSPRLVSDADLGEAHHLACGAVLVASSHNGEHVLRDVLLDHVQVGVGLVHLGLSV